MVKYCYVIMHWCIINTMEKEQYFSITEAARKLGVHPNTLRRWDQKGILKSVRIGERGDRKYTLADLENIISKGRNQFKGPQKKDIPHVGVGVMILSKNNKVLMSQREQKYGLGEYAFPGGRIPFGESPKEAAKREVKIKIGLEINPKPFCTVASTRYLEIGEYPITIIFQARINKKVVVPLNWEWYKMEKLPSPLFAPCEEAFKCMKTNKSFNF